MLLTVLLIAAGGSTVAWAQAVQRSGNIFHRAVCPGPDRPGTARCHAHIVTDSKGNDQERGAAPNLTPSGYGAATLRAVYNIVPSNSSMVIFPPDGRLGCSSAECAPCEFFCSSCRVRRSISARNSS